jgi:hypothetical protein
MTSGITASDFLVGFFCDFRLAVQARWNDRQKRRHLFFGCSRGHIFVRQACYVKAQSLCHWGENPTPPCQTASALGGQLHFRVGTKPSKAVKDELLQSAIPLAAMRVYRI